MGPHADYTGPDGAARTRRGFFCRVRIEDYGPGRVRPHERTHPGPKEDRLRLTRSHPREHLAHLLALLRPRASGLEGAGAATADTPWGEITDGDGTVHRLWRVSDPDAIAAVQAATRDVGAADRRRPPPLRDRCRPTPRSSAARASTATSSCAWSRSRTRG